MNIVQGQKNKTNEGAYVILGAVIGAVVVFAVEIFK
jgi:hypothetical protein